MNSKTGITFSIAAITAVTALQQKLQLRDDDHFRLAVADQHVATVVIDRNSRRQISHHAGEFQVMTVEIIIRAQRDVRHVVLASRWRAAKIHVFEPGERLNSLLNQIGHLGVD